MAHKTPLLNTQSPRGMKAQLTLFLICMNTIAETPLHRWTCVWLHLQSRISVRHPLQSVLFHLYGIGREFTPNRSFSRMRFAFVKS